MLAIAISEVDWHKPPNETDIPDWHRCDFCDGSAIEDFSEGKEARRFFRQTGGNNDGLIVCEACIDAFLAEPLD